MNSLPSYDNNNNNDNNGNDFSHDYMSLYTPMLLAEEEEQQEEVEQEDVEQNAIPDSNPSSSLSIVATSSAAAAAAAAASVDISTATGCSSSNKKRCILSGLHCTYAAAAATATATATTAAAAAAASPSAAFASRLPPTSVRRAIMFPQQPSCGRPLAIHQEENQNQQKRQIPYNLKPMHLQQLSIQQKQQHFHHQQQQSVQQFLMQHHIQKQKQKQRQHQQQQQQQHQHHQQMLQQQQQKQAVMQHELLRQQVMNLYSPQTNEGINSNSYPSHFSTQTTPLLGSAATATSYVQAGNMIPSNQNRWYSNVNTNQQQQQQQKRKEYSSSEDEDEDDYDNQDDDEEAPSPQPPKKKKIKKIRRILNETYKKEQNEKWEKNFILLKEYKKKHGNTIVPYSAQLGNWVRHQRRYMDNMSIERFNRLNEDLNFTWRCLSAKPWMDMYCKFKLYKEEEKEKQEKQKQQQQQQHNDDNDDEEIASPSASSSSSSPPSSSLSFPLLCEKDRDLGLWVQAQRFWCKSPKRIILLNEIDFVWDELSEKI